MTQCRWFTGAVAALGLAPTLWGLAAPHQLDQRDPVFSARSELVVLQVLVEDRRGASVAKLTADAFTVLEDGRPQAIQFFGAQDAPVTVGLLIDSSGSMQPIQRQVVAAAFTFVETSNPLDEVFALTFSDRVAAALPVDAPFTSDASTLRVALTRALSPHGRTALFDALVAGLDYVGKGRYERRVLVVVADGGENASTATFEQVLARAQGSNTLIYTIALVDPLDRDRNPKRLERIARASGGEAFAPRTIGDVPDVVRHIAQDIRSMYTVSYAPADAPGAARFRRIRVVVRTPGRSNLRVHTRQGYRIEERQP